MRSLLILLLIIALPVSAQIYKYTDAEGNTAYSNQPPSGVKAHEVQLAPLNSIEQQPQNTSPAPSKPSTLLPVPPAATYDVLELTDLPTEEALRANNGTFIVGVKISPHLAPSDQLQLLLDGNRYGQPSNVPRLQLVNIDRGEHTLAVEIISGDQVLQVSTSQTFTVQRVHKP